MKQVYHRLFPGFAQELEKELADCKSLIDIGCGSASPIKYTSFNGYSLGIDGFKPSIKNSKKSKIHSKYKLMNLLELGKNIKPKTFDCAIALDVIEHFTKEDGETLLASMEKIATKKIIIFTTNGFRPQGAYDNNQFQVHLSGWTPKEMKLKGYKVIGMHGLKSLRGNYAKIRFWPKPFWRLISDITQKIFINEPDKTYAILCVKNLQEVNKFKYQ